MLKVIKNGNIHLKIEKDDAGLSIIEKIYFNYDLYPVGEEYCISNYATACDYCFNGGSNYYTISSIDLFNLEAGKTIVLYPLQENYINEFLLNEEVC